MRRTYRPARLRSASLEDMEGEPRRLPTRTFLLRALAILATLAILALGLILNSMPEFPTWS